MTDTLYTGHRTRDRATLTCSFWMTWQIQGLQNTCAQCVITGTVKESKQIAHSSSEPELRINFIFLINFVRSSSGVSFPAGKAENVIPKQNLNMTSQIHLCWRETPPLWVVSHIFLSQAKGVKYICNLEKKKIRNKNRSRAMIYLMENCRYTMLCTRSRLQGNFGVSPCALGSHLSLQILQDCTPISLLKPSREAPSLREPSMWS